MIKTIFGIAMLISIIWGIIFLGVNYFWINCILVIWAGIDIAITVVSKLKLIEVKKK